MKTSETKPLVGILMGSDSDWPTMKAAADVWRNSASPAKPRSFRPIARRKIWSNTPAAPSDFIRDIVAEKSKHVAEKKYPRIHTRFPPEPNGYLHIGHAKSICLNFGIAREFGGICNLRMDDTNPTKEDVEYVDSIIEDVNWLISGWADQNLGLKPKGKTPEAGHQQRQAGFLPAATGDRLPV
jgi:hypothetical protein